MPVQKGAIKSDVFLSRRVGRARAKPTKCSKMVGFATLQSLLITPSAEYIMIRKNGKNSEFEKKLNF